MDWMTPREKADFLTACELIDSIKNPRDFYRVIRELNEHYSVDIVNCARAVKKCYNSAQYQEA